jgi:hypothetical protein
MCFPPTDNQAETALHCFLSIEGWGTGQMERGPGLKTKEEQERSLQSAGPGHQHSSRRRYQNMLRVVIQLPNTSSEALAVAISSSPAFYHSVIQCVHWTLSGRSQEGSCAGQLRKDFWAALVACWLGLQLVISSFQGPNMRNLLSRKHKQKLH